MHLNHEENGTMTLLEWETKKIMRRACRALMLESGVRSGNVLFEEGNIRWELETFEVLYEFRKNQNAN